MAIAQTIFTEHLPSSAVEQTTHLGVHAVFRALPVATTQIAMAHIMMTLMERKDRVVFMLLDGKRTLRDVARLVHRSERDVARTLVRLLQRGYIEYVGELDTTFAGEDGMIG